MNAKYLFTYVILMAVTTSTGAGVESAIDTLKSKEWRQLGPAFMTAERIEQTDPRGRDLMSALIITQDPERVDFLGISAAHLNRRRPQRDEGLPQFAALISSVEFLRLLLDRGMEVNFKDGTGYGPAAKAALSIRYESVELLLDRGANAKAVGPKGQSLASLLRLPARLSERMEIIRQRLLKRLQE